MLEVIERILAAVIVLAIASLLIFITARSMGITSPNNVTDSRPNQTGPSTPPTPPRPTATQTPQSGTRTATQTQTQTQTRTTNRTPAQPVRAPAREETTGGSSIWPWNWNWRWPCPTGTQSNGQGGCYDPAAYQRQASYEAPYRERRPRYQPRRTQYDAPPPDERGYYHPEADPYGRYEREEPYFVCEGDEGCRRRQPCVPNYGYYDRQPCGNGCGNSLPYWQRESYRASFGYAPYRSHQGDPLNCD